MSVKAITDSSALVFGGTAGIGLASAERLLRDGLPRLVIATQAGGVKADGRSLAAQIESSRVNEKLMAGTINNLTTSSENITSAESRIRDVDMAAEMAEYTKLSVINQAATAMLAQANQQPEQVLSLLQ